MKGVIMPYIFDKYESEYQEWKNNGYQGCKTETIEFIDHLLHRQNKTLWAHQKEAILRIIFLYEIKRGIKQNHLLKIVTGGGKTLIIASIIAWLKYAHNNINKFLIIVPNLIVRDRITLDFIKEGNRLNTIFEDWDMTPDKMLNGSISAVVLEAGSSPQAMVGADVIVTNIQELYPVHANTGANLAYIHSNFDNIVIFNDEAHNTNANIFDSILKSLEDKTILRIDTTATPERADGTYPTSSLIYQFDIKDAISTVPPIIKDIVVYQPETKLVEITYTNAETRERKKISEMDKDFEDFEKRLKPFQWIMDKAPLKMLTQIALNRLIAKENEAKGQYKPILFIVTMGIKEAEDVKTYLEEEKGIKTLIVTEKSEDEDRELARTIGKPDNPYKAVVSIFMLREGWDVAQVSVILLLRKILSPVFGQQIIGRGLRKIDKASTEREILFVVDHPMLQHKWLWEKMMVARIRPDVMLDDTSEEPPLPKQEDYTPRLVNRNNLIIIDEIVDTDFDEKINKLSKNINSLEPVREWKQKLELAAYNKEYYTITKVRLESIHTKYLGKKFGEEINYDASSSASDDTEEEITIDKLKSELIFFVEHLLEKGSLSETEKGKVYTILLEHISKKFLNGKYLSESSNKERVTILNNFEEMDKVFSIGILKGIIEYG